MTEERVKRKISAILSADVAGYSRLMGEDEVSTVRTLEAYRKVMSDLIGQFRGRVVDSPGDNLLAEFSSVVDAVQCAVEIHEVIRAKNEELPEDRRMLFRIGVNLGDVIEEGDRIYGDGVNIAARLEGLAEAGGICISGSAHEQIENKLALGYEYIGEHTVKNIAKPVKVYRVPMGPKSATPKEGDEKKTKSKKWQWTAYGAAGAIIVIIGALAIWYFSFRQTPVVVEVKEGPKTIAVLPFTDLSPEKDQEYFADGIAEELINSLTRIRDLGVTGRTSSFSFKGSNKTIQEIASVLGVEYILEGSVRKAGSDLRITAQLVRAADDLHLLSKTYDRELKDIFDVQDDIAQSVADALQITLGVGELGRAPGMTRDIAAYDAFLEGRSLRLQSGREDLSQAIEQLEQAVALDPDFAICWNYLADAYEIAFSAFPERGEEFLAKSKSAFSRVFELAPETDLALRIAASRSGDYMEVERLYKKAISLNPANFDTNYGYGWFLNQMGRPSEAIDYHQRCVRMEPLSPEPHFQLGVAYELSGNIDAAAMAMKKARELTNQPAFYNVSLMVLALEESNRALIDEYVALVLNTELLGINRSDTRDINQVMHDLLDKPEEAVAELRLFLTDPAYNNPFNRAPIAVWASYFGEHELALQVYREMGRMTYLSWRPIHKAMRQLPGFKDLVRDFDLVDYWRKSGKWGDFCHPVGDDDFECD